MLDGASRIGEVVADGGGRRPARGRHHRPREHVRRPRLLQGRARGRHQAGHRHGGLLVTNDVALRPAEARRARDLPPHAARRDRRRATATSSRSRAHAYLDGYYHKPRVDWELLEQHHEGIIATTGCLGGAVLAGAARRTTTTARSRAVDAVPGRSSGATRSSSSCRTTASPSSTQVEPAAARASRASCSAPLLATNDSHYTHQRRRRGARRAAVRADRRAARATRSASSSTATSST